MSSQYMSPAVANVAAQAIAALFSNGVINFYAGDPAAGGSLLASGQLPIAPFSAPVSGVLTLAGQWFATVSVAGQVTNARISDAAGTNFLPLTVGVTGSGADIIVTKIGSTNTATDNVLVVGEAISVTAFTYTV